MNSITLSRTVTASFDEMSIPRRFAPVIARSSMSRSLAPGEKETRVSIVEAITSWALGESPPKWTYRVAAAGSKKNSPNTSSVAREFWTK